MEWTVVLAGPAKKGLKRAPTTDRTRIIAALERCSKIHFKVISGMLQELPGFRRRVRN
jgi:hypothetical protein